MPSAWVTILFVLYLFFYVENSYATTISKRPELYQGKRSLFIRYFRKSSNVLRSKPLHAIHRDGLFRYVAFRSQLSRFTRTTNGDAISVSTQSDHQASSSMFAQLNLSQCMTLYLLPSSADTPANQQRFKLDLSVRKAVLPHFYTNKGPCRRVVHADSLQLFGKCFEIDIHVGNQNDFDTCRSAPNFRRCVWNVGNILTNTILTVPVRPGRARVKQGDKTIIRLFDKPKCTKPESMATLTVKKAMPRSGAGKPTAISSPSSTAKPRKRTPTPTPTRKPKSNMAKPSKSSSPSAKPKPNNNNNPSSSSFGISSCVRMRASASSASSVRVILIRSMLQDNDSECKPLIYAKSVRVRGTCAVFTENIACKANSVPQWRQCIKERPVSVVVTLFEKSATFKIGGKNFVGLYSNRECSRNSTLVDGELPVLSATYGG